MPVPWTVNIWGLVYGQLLARTVEVENRVISCVDSGVMVTYGGPRAGGMLRRLAVHMAKPRGCASDLTERGGRMTSLHIVDRAREHPNKGCYPNQGLGWNGALVGLRCPIVFQCTARQKGDGAHCAEIALPQHHERTAIEKDLAEVDARQ